MTWEDPWRVRRDVIANAYRLYHAGRIGLPELLRTVQQWRPPPATESQVVLDDPEAHP